jgi:protein TonB
VPATRADPVLSAARAAFDAGRYDAPAGRNALDLYKAVLLARPGSSEAQQGLDRTVTKIMEQATLAKDTGDVGEARRLVDRVLAVDPGRRSARALSERLKAEAMPSVTGAVTPSQQLAAESMSVPEAVPAAVTAPQEPAPAAVVTRTPVVQRDPLAPRFTNTPAAGPAPSKGRTRAYGAPITTGLPIAGYVTSPSAGSQGSPDTFPSSKEPVQAMPATPSPRLAPDALERLVVVDPVYPAQALRSRTNGWVELEFTITESGVVRDIQVVESWPRGVFEQSAASALGQWRFRPRVVNGQPVAQRSSVTLRFDVDS